MKKLLVTLCVGILICSSVSATIGTSASTTFTAGTTSVASTPSFSYDCHAASADNDTVIFNAYQLYNSSVTYAYRSGSPGNSSVDYIPYVYNLAKHTSLSSSKQGIYATGKNSPTYLKVRSGKYIIIKVTNVTGVIISGNSGGDSRYVELSAYTDLDSDPVKTTATLGKTNGTEAISGLTAGTTYFIKIAGTADNSDSKVYEIGLIYPHAEDCTSHSVTATVSGGVGGSVSAGATTVCECGTTTITATPNSGYRVSNWAVSGTSASISPNGASSSTTTTLTMGTADATVTVTFEAIPTYTVTHTLSNVSKTSGGTTATEGTNYTAVYSTGVGYALPSTITVTIGGSTATAGDDYTWTQGTGTLTIDGASVTDDIEVTITGVASCTDISPSLSYASTTLSVGGTSATPTLTGNTGSGAVTYSSSNTSVATVASTGVVTAVAAGSATITASIAANGGYCADTATASFTVNCVDPGLSISLKP